MSSIAGVAWNGKVGDSSAAEASVLGTDSVAVDDDGNIYFANGFTVRRTDSGGKVTVVVGKPEAASDCTYDAASEGKPATSAATLCPSEIALDDAGNLYFIDEYANRVYRVDDDGVLESFAGGGSSESETGNAGDRLLKRVIDVATDSDDNVIVTDWNAGKVYRVSPNGTLGVFAGGGQGDIVTGALATDTYLSPTIATPGPNGTLLVVQGYAKLLSIGTDGMIAVLAGGDTSGVSAGDDGPATNATFSEIRDVAVDPDGNIYVVDGMGDTYRIRRIGTDGVITAVV